MKTILIAAATLVLGVVIGVAICWPTIRYLRRRVRSLKAELNGRGKLDRLETHKKVTWICLANGFAWVWCSYLLAAMDKTQIAESLSQVAVTEIIGVVLAYCIKSAVENLSKNNSWPDKAPTARNAITEPEPESTPDDTGAAG